MQEFALKILVVEDNDALREATLAFLQQRGHYVRGVPTAEDVNDVTGGFVPDVYVIDLGLPDEDGLSLTRRLRASHPKAGIVITTARAQLGERVNGYQSGADLYLTKPVHPDELGAAVASIGARLQLDAKPPGSLVLSAARLRLSGPKGVVELSAGEASVLGALARAPGQSLERWQIAEIISGNEHSTPSAATIEMRITRLRRKLLEAGSEQPSIKAVHKVGYTLCCPVTLE
jgi:DNA-binding response OmpR family regulator